MGGCTLCGESGDFQAGNTNAKNVSGYKDIIGVRLKHLQSALLFLLWLETSGWRQCGPFGDIFPAGHSFVTLTRKHRFSVTDHENEWIRFSEWHLESVWSLIAEQNEASDTKFNTFQLTVWPLPSTTKIEDPKHTNEIRSNQEKKHLRQLRGRRWSCFLSSSCVITSQWILCPSLTRYHLKTEKNPSQKHEGSAHPNTDETRSYTNWKSL